MIIIKIGSDERNINNYDEGWLNQQISRRKRDGVPVCIQVIIKEDELNMILSTSDCTKSGGTRVPYPKEKEIFELWDKRGLNKSNFTGGNLIAFLKQLVKMI